MGKIDLCLDTSILIEYLRAKDKTKTTLEQAVYKYGVSVTPISAYEIYRGAKSQKQIDQADKLFSLLRVLEIDYQCGRNAGITYRKLRDEGITIDSEDILIGVIALRHNLPVLTLNIDHFRVIPNLRVLSPDDLVKVEIGGG